MLLILPWDANPRSGGVAHTRITMDDDFISQKGFDRALFSIRQVASKHTTSLIWVSIPCTGGSAWQRYNLAYGSPSTKDKVKGHREIFDLLWANLVKLVQQLEDDRCYIAIEWPRGCSYWLLSRVKSFITRYTPTIVHFDGCMFGLKDKDGGYIRKP